MQARRARALTILLRQPSASPRSRDTGPPPASSATISPPPAASVDRLLTNIVSLRKNAGWPLSASRGIATIASSATRAFRMTATFPDGRLQARTGPKPQNPEQAAGDCQLPGHRAGRASLRSGSRLVRDWNGVTHVVDLVKHRCRHQGHVHRSLSPLAREITAARWSPPFFGLKSASG